ncbi:PAS domain-containing protein [Haloarcula nitratireducens]|uniref:histidine kinase n=1 Tax=Haloarcula nitratireducens TaxID=2487749 RepID=A0AAW4P6W2_9EURY|nr:PAS domain-containing protein [Halomicroarcula nitratireducens]MBX0293539.1 PAS domain-containing protein [Halomicroarcula nitratireducens]
MSSGRVASEAVLAACDRLGRAHEPVTATEVADELGCESRAVADKLAELVEQGRVASKVIGDQRVWWLPDGPGDVSVPDDASPQNATADGPTGPENGEGDPPEAEDVLRRISDGFYALDDEWRFTHVNERAVELIDYRDEGLVGRNIWEVFEWAADSKLGEEYRTAMATQEPTAFEFYYPEPLSAWYRVHAYPSESGLSVYFQDVTERKERQRRLERSERRYRTLVEHFPNGAVALVDDSLRYQTVGGVPPDTVDAAAAELESQHVRDALPAPLADELAPRYEAALDGDASTFEFEFDESVFRIRTVPVRDEAGDVSAALGMSQDVTEQKERERRLRDAKAQFEAATAAGAVGTWEWYVQEDRVVTDTASAEKFGLEPDAVREGVPLDQFVDAVYEDDRERVEAEIEAAIESDGEYEAEYRVWDADGDLRWVVARGHVERDADGDAVRFPGALTDITERKRAERERDEHRKMLQTLFEVLPVGVVVTDGDGRFSEVNDAARELLDIGSQAVENIADYGRYRGRWADTGEPVAPQEWALNRILRGEKVTRPDVYEIETADGERKIVMVHGMPIRDANGEVTHGVVTLTDITARRTYQRQLEESERRYRTLAEHFPNGAVGVFDRDLRYTVAQGSEIGNRLPGRAELEGGRMPDVFPSDVAADLEPLFEAAVEDGETDSAATEFGGRTWRVWATPLRDASGEIFAGLSFAQDITEQVEREARLEETVEKLEASNERLESFASMLAHEIRNPVTIGQIYSKQLSDEAEAEAADYVAEAFDRIEDMIDVMLVLARGNAAVGKPEPVAVDDAVEAAWEQVDSAAAELRLSTDRRLQADPRYLQHLFRNLFENAVEHGGDAVTVTVGELPTGFYVEDDGSGIPDDEVGSVFEPGYTTAAGRGGTGLGLAFVRELARVYGWEWTVTESESGGARFEFTGAS